MRIYNRYKKLIEYIIYPIALVLLPLMNFNQGVDVSDSTYSLGNYLFAGRLEGMWVISTYLSNALGSFIMKLPGATCLRGANIYTGLILGGLGLMVYLFLRRDFDARYVFLGEFAAICFCWIPTGILYNYLSYFLMALGAILLYKGIVTGSWRYELAAGMVLGANVFARIPNITQMALILSLWFACFIKKKNCLKDTGICIGGYAIGVGIPGIFIIAKYGVSGIADMINGLSGITSTDETYTPVSMITGPILAYLASFRWLAIVIVVTVCGTIMFRLLPGKLVAVKTIIYIGVIALMLRFFWGRGMFSFRYYEDYTSMYEWGVMALYLSIAVDLFYIVRAVLNRKEADIREISMAVISLVVIMIAPLGSNNKLYQNLNNLFLVMPFTIYALFGAIRYVWAKKNAFSVPVVTMVYVLIAVIMVQSFGFANAFVFRDGMRGEKRDTEITGVETLEGMYTNSENAQALMGLCGFMKELDDCGYTGKTAQLTTDSSIQQVSSVILFGNCPGLTYILNKPSALFSSWIDLDSNPVKLVEDELNSLKNIDENIPVIIKNGSGSAVAYEQKQKLIDDYIAQGGYELAYENAQYKVYCR